MFLPEVVILSWRPMQNQQPDKMYSLYLLFTFQLLKISACASKFKEVECQEAQQVYPHLRQHPIQGSQVYEVLEVSQ